MGENNFIESKDTIQYNIITKQVSAFAETCLSILVLNSTINILYTSSVIDISGK